MDNNNPYVQGNYTSGVDHSSSTNAGKQEAARGGYCAPQQTNESYDAYMNRVSAFNNARQSSGN